MTTPKLKYEKNGAIVMIITMFANLFNYIFQIAMGNMMSVAEYGILTALISLYSMLGMFVGLLQLFTARNIAAYRAMGKYGQAKAFLFSVLKCGGIVALVLTIVAAISASSLAHILNISNVQYIYFVFAGTIVGIFTMIVWGVFQGCEKFISFSLSNDLASVVKLIVAVELVSLGMGVRGVLLALIISNLTVVIWGGAEFIKKHNIPNEKLLKDSIAGNKVFTIEVIIIQLLMALLTNCDVLLMKIFITNEEVVGIYAAAVTIGKLPLYLVTSLTTVLLPTIAAAKAKNDNFIKYFNKVVLYTLGIFVFYGLCLKVFGGNIISFLYGERYLEATKLFLIIGIFTFLISIATIMMNYFIGCAESADFFKSLLIGSGLIGMGIYLKHGTIQDILYIICLGLTVIVTFNFGKIYGKK